MKNSLKYTLPFTFIFILQSFMFSQEIPECGTIETPESLEFYQNNKQKIMELEKAYLKNPTLRSTIHVVDVKAHVIRTSSGTGGLTESELDSAIDDMNAFYASANMYFYLCDGINYIDDDTYYDLIYTDEGVLTDAHSVDNLINIYFANSVTRFDSEGEPYFICGYAYYPGNQDTIVMDNSCALNGSTLAHEMGHFYSLRHTHGGTVNELVDGSNCTTEGDYLCDTPADPKLSNNSVTAACVYTGTTTDANGDTYIPDPTNVMSYSRKPCRTSFTPQQFARIFATHQEIRNYFFCVSLELRLIANKTQTPDKLFAVNSTGATAEDGDDIVDDTNISVNIYPNPVITNVLHVKFSRSLTSVNYKITNILGQEIMSNVLENDTIDIENIESGTYFLSFEINGNVLIKRFIKR